MEVEQFKWEGNGGLQSNAGVWPHIGERKEGVCIRSAGFVCEISPLAVMREEPINGAILGVVHHGSASGGAPNTKELRGRRGDPDHLMRAA